MTAEKTIIDPTKNVLDLVEAERKHRDSLRRADIEFQNAMREAETRRINELAAQALTFNHKMADVLRANQDAASTLLATQLKEVKSDLQVELRSLNQFRWETGGKTAGINSVGALIIGAAMVISAVIGVAGFLLHH